MPITATEVHHLPFDKIPQLSSKDIAYATADPRLRNFYKYPVKLEAFAEVIDDKKRADTDRQTLVRVLNRQYSELSRSEKVHANVDALLYPTTFTITTAHQPSLFTGPLYYIYKIISTINLAECLQRKYPDYHFVPIFISGSEDHDFEEINHANLFNKTITWENDESGGCGFMRTEGLKQPLAELREILGDTDRAQHIFGIIEKAYTRHGRYGEATQELVHELFKDDGLVVVNMSDAELKRLFIPIMEEEILKQPSQQLVEETQQELAERAGFSDQAHARKINLFYLDDQLRERIVFEDGKYQVLNTDLAFTEAELKKALHDHPERFSPNVVMRPLYQELVLPNLAYVGGGGEIAYWLERQSQFAHFGVNFPMLVRRNSVLWVDGGMSKKVRKLDLSIEDLFIETETLIKAYVEENSENELSLEEEKAKLQQLFDELAERTKAIDPTLEKTVLAEGAKQVKSLENLEGRLMKAEKQRFDTSLNQIRSLKDRLFPNNGLQERHDNFLQFYLKYGDDFFQILKENLEPLRPEFVVIVDN